MEPLLLAQEGAQRAHQWKPLGSSWPASVRAGAPSLGARSTGNHTTPATQNQKTTGSSLGLPSPPGVPGQHLASPVQPPDTPLLELAPCCPLSIHASVPITARPWSPSWALSLHPSF